MRQHTRSVSPATAELFRVYGRIGLLSFGGPAGQIALMHRVLVEERRWLSEPSFLHALNFCMLLPGPEAQQLATYSGWLAGGVRGGLIAGLLFVLPGALVVLALSALYAAFAQAPLLAGVFLGVKAAVLAVVIEALLKVAGRVLKTQAAWWLAGAAFAALFLFDAPFPLVILAAGAAGFVGGKAAPAQFAIIHGKAAPSEGQASGEGGWAHALRTTALGLGVWAAPLALILAMGGFGGVYWDIALFFSKLAVVTFGGAYAVLAYMAQQAVEGYGWLNPGEMLDGLGLAETTPGPLILVTQFVGFLAAFREAAGLNPWLAGILGALLTTWVTFAPCFLWIFLGAPYVERLRASPPLAGALSAVTAAVVGVIANLALWFGLHALFAEQTLVALWPLELPLPAPSSLDPWALGLFALACSLLLYLKRGLFLTLGACAALGALTALV